MKYTICTLAVLALLLTFAAPLLNAFGMVGDAAMKHTLLAATVLWFVVAPRWLRNTD